jgi:hypothetical protein
MQNVLIVRRCCACLPRCSQPLIDAINHKTRKKLFFREKLLLLRLRKSSALSPDNLDQRWKVKTFSENKQNANGIISSNFITQFTRDEECFITDRKYVRKLTANTFGGARMLRILNASRSTHFRVRQTHRQSLISSCCSGRAHDGERKILLKLNKYL